MIGTPAIFRPKRAPFEDLGNMFQFYAEFEDSFTGARPLDVARRLNPELQDFATFVARNASRIPLG